jgi:hypothetical protein
MVYLALFGLGRVLLGGMWLGTGLLFASAVCAGLLYSNILRSDWGGGEPQANELRGTAPSRVLH